MANKLLVYPLHPETVPIVRHSELLDYEIGAAVSPQSWGYTGKDVGFCDGGPEMGISVTSDFSAALELCEVVFMTFVTDQIDRRTYKEYINESLSAGKQLIITAKLVEFLGMELSDTEQIQIVGSNKAERTDRKGMMPIPIPVILIAGIGENCNKFNLQLEVRKYFNKKCSNIMQLGTKDYSELFGFRSLPDFIYDPIDISTKIISLNRYIWSEIKRNRSELLILGIPGGFSYMTMDEPRGFGELAFCITSAVNADACILSVYGNTYSPDEISEIIPKATIRLSCPIACTHISNQKISIDPDAVNEKVTFLTIKQSHVPVCPGTFNFFDKQRSDAAFERLYCLLLDAEEIV